MNRFADIVRTKVTEVYRIVLAQDFLLALLIAVLLIVIMVFLGHENNKIVPVSNLSLVHYQQEPNNPLSFMAEWDGPDYIAIAQHGYVNQNQTNFFPLYPLLIHVVSLVVRSAVDSALIVAWASLVGALYYYIKIAKKLFRIKDNREAIKAVLLLIIFPTAVFLVATYTESLFAFLALGAMYYALRKKYLVAGLFALPLTATHTNGVFVLIMIALILYEEKEKLSHIVISFCVGLLGLVGYMIFLAAHFHNALAFISAQQQHGWLRHHYGDLRSQLNYINLTLMILMVIAIVYWWQRRKSFSVYVALYLLVPIIGGQIGGFNRYALMVFPVQFMLYEKFRKNSLGYSLVIVLSTLLCAHFLFQYTGGYVGG